jgi:alpha-N-arabinofuranosidase
MQTNRFLIVALLLTACSAALAQQPAISNGGFESAEPHAGWTVHVYGAQSSVAEDARVEHGGLKSLRISADSPSDTALGQEISLRARRFYRLTGWVRTRGLNPMGAPVFGTFQVQKPGGAGVIASGKNHAGDNEWTEVAIPFQAPADGRTRIAIFFVGYGRGTGAAWFDDIRIEPMNLDNSPLRITRKPLHAGRISPLQYGQFIEYLCDLVPGMWAEKLYDGGFEGFSPYKFVYLKETDFREKPWVPSGATNRAVFAPDRSTKVNGEASQRIEVAGGAPCTVGIEQSGISVNKGVACRFSVWMKEAGIRGPVTARLHKNGRTLAAASVSPNGEWKKLSAEMRPAETATDCTLTIAFRGPGTLWLDNASLMPADSVGGWRRDVVEALRLLKPGVIRFGGSALDDPNLGDFRWRDSIGDPDHRPPFRAWGGLQQAGAGLEEIVQLCRAVGSEPLICVRFSRSTPEEAAAEVEYFNGPAASPMGALRARNGHPKPYGIRFWQVGNEVGGPEYEAKLPAFCAAMKRADPSIQLLSSFPTAGVLRGAGNLLDFVCPHQYGVADLAGTENELEAVRRLIGGGRARVAVTEWNTTAGDAGPRRAMLWTLENALACARYQNLLHRESDLVEIANRSNLTNSFCSGIIQTDRSRLYKTPTYYMQMLYANLAGDIPLRIDSDAPPNLGLDVSATLNRFGDVVLFAVNPSLEPITRPLDFTGFGKAGRSAEVWTLADKRHAGEPDATNSFDDPERVAPVHSALPPTSARFAYKFPPLSLTVIRWPKRAESGRRQ